VFSEKSGADLPWVIADDVDAIWDSFGLIVITGFAGFRLALLFLSFCTFT
jgi:hypothetical protein